MEDMQTMSTADEVVLHDDGRGHVVMKSVPSVDIAHDDQADDLQHGALDPSTPTLSNTPTSTSTVTTAPPDAISASDSPIASAGSPSGKSSSADVDADADADTDTDAGTAADADAIADSSQVTSLPPSQSPSVSTPRRISTLDPYNLRTKKSMKIRDAALMESLKFNAVEIAIEIYGMSRMELFTDAQDVIALYVPSTQNGSWTKMDESETMKNTSHMKCVKKFRLRAATSIDRAENYVLALFPMSRNSDGNRLNRLNPHDALGFEQVSVGELLEATNMMVEKRLKNGRRETMTKGRMVVALDIVYHIENDRRITITFGFDEMAERRNRMYFEVSRALRRGKWSPLYKSEVRTKDDLKQFDAVTFSSQEFHGGDEKKLFRIELFRWYRNGRTRALGFAQASFEKLVSLRVNDCLYWWPVEEGISSSKLVMHKSHVTHEECSFSFVMAPLQAHR